MKHFFKHVTPKKEKTVLLNKEDCITFAFMEISLYVKGWIFLLALCQTILKEKTE